MRVAVIGAGIVGGSIALHLAERGAEITLIDAGQPGHGASRVSFAWINGRDKNPRGYHELNRRSQDMWRRFADRLQADVGLTWGGEMRWSVTADGAAELQRASRSCNRGAIRFVPCRRTRRRRWSRASASAMSQPYRSPSRTATSTPFASRRHVPDASGSLAER
ncbi:MAG: FAD-binding oxidoreductase [Chloroflexi bacterium]|nr:FAD-binding oxidoreductase [Chloroflexota bacterium]